MGAAICAGVGVGIYPDFKVVRKLNPPEERVMPNPEYRTVYDRLYKIFNETSEALKPMYRELAGYRGEAAN